LLLIKIVDILESWAPETKAVGEATCIAKKEHVVSSPDVGIGISGALQQLFENAQIDIPESAMGMEAANVTYLFTRGR